MKKILFILLLTIPFVGFAQVKKYECNCKETQFRQIFEIDLQNQTIKHSSSLNLKTGEVLPGKIKHFENVIWKDDFIYSLWKGEDYYPSQFSFIKDVFFYRFDLVNNLFISEIYDDGDGSLFEQVYKCFWYN